MNDYNDINCLGMEPRKCANLKYYTRYIVRDNPTEAFKGTGIKDAFKGLGTIEAIAKVRNGLTQEDNFVVFVKKDDEFYFYEYSDECGVNGKRGPYKDLNTAMSNADCSGLFEENTKSSRYNVFTEELDTDYDVEDLNEFLF